MPRPRSTYTAEFKLSAVKMITEQKLSVAEAAAPRCGREPAARVAQGVPRQGRPSVPGHGNPAPAGDELRRLRERATQGRAGSAKKAAAYFANPPT